jgi:hypothetical protein
LLNYPSSSCIVCFANTLDHHLLITTHPFTLPR